MNLELKLQILTEMLGQKVEKKHLERILSSFIENNIDIPLKSKQIFFDFRIDETMEASSIDYLLEQLETVCQIMINQGYNIVICNSYQQQEKICRDFVDVFHSEAIRFIKQDDNDMVIMKTLCESEHAIVMGEEFYLSSLLLEKPCIPMFIEEDYITSLPLDKAYIKSDNFHAGIILDKIYYLENNILIVKEELSKLFHRDMKGSLYGNNYKNEMDHLDSNKTDMNKKYNEMNDEIKNYQQQFKNNIQILIEQNMLQEAKEMLLEYQKIVPYDKDVYSIKGIIAMMEGDFSEAEHSFEQGIKVDKDHLDFYHNLAYLYEVKEDYVKANSCYYKAYHRSNDTEKAYLVEKINANQENLTKPPMMSVIVLAYNNLEYTKLCIESIYEQVSHFSFQLITVNNGSQDGTTEYFHSLPRHTMVEFDKNMGISIGFNEALKHVKGEYLFYVSNDIILTEHSVNNIVDISQKEPDFGMIVPVCNYSSNYQQINLQYQTMEEMKELACQYNMANKHIYHERVRLVPYVLYMRSSVMKDIGGLGLEYGYGGYDDDDVTYRIRRAGYKLILALGTFVHHFGSKTVTKVINKELINKNKKIFMDKFGVDSWECATVHNNFIQNIHYKTSKTNPIELLGVDCLIGADLLEIKNRYRDNNITVSISAITNEPKYFTDLKSISKASQYTDIEETLNYYPREKFDHIMIGTKFIDLQQVKDYTKVLTQLLSEDGDLVFYIDKQMVLNSNLGIDVLAKELIRGNEKLELSYLSENDNANKGDNMEQGDYADRYLFHIKK